MTKVVYDGPHQAVEVPAADVVVDRGVPVDLPDHIADRLLEQADWKPAPKRAGSKERD